MGAIVERWYIRVVPVLVAFHEKLTPAWIQGAYGLGQVAIRARRVQVNRGRVIVDEDPRKYQILVERDKTNL